MMWPDQSRDHIRGLYDEVATLRQEMAEAEAEAHRRADDLAEVDRRLQVVCERHDALHAAASRVVQLVTHGADGLVVGEAIAEMRRVLDGTS